MADLLSAEDIATLPVGTELEITWSGGNGPHTYTLSFWYGIPWARTDEDRYVDANRFLLDSIGPSPLTEVRLK
jgi:hypothetical protein